MLMVKLWEMQNCANIGALEQLQVSFSINSQIDEVPFFSWCSKPDLIAVS